MHIVDFILITVLNLQKEGKKTMMLINDLKSIEYRSAYKINRYQHKSSVKMCKGCGHE